MFSQKVRLLLSNIAFGTSFIELVRSATRDEPLVQSLVGAGFILGVALWLQLSALHMTLCDLAKRPASDKVPHHETPPTS